MKVKILIKGYNFQLQRFILPLFLHQSFLHIFGNILAQIIFGIRLETFLGAKHIALLYYVSGIGNYFYLGGN
jgi:membrane associated rhomboid family serine protease